MRALRTSSQIDRAWDDSDLDDAPAAPVPPRAQPPTLALGTQTTLDALLDDQDGSISEPLAMAAPEPPVRTARRYRRWVVAGLACGVAAIVFVVLGSRQPIEHARVSSPPAAIAASSPAKPSSRAAVPVASAPARKPTTKSAPKPARKIAATSTRASAAATKHEVRPAKRAVHATKVAASAKKPAVKPSKRGTATRSPR